MKSKEELKKLFENGDKPTQEEFWEWQDSYWHKGEKLPSETAGLYKVKGSVPDLTTLNYMSNMSEGDVYNVIETGDNYVYVLDLNNTGEPGWDKLSGIIDLSSINLQTVLDNGGVASFKNGIQTAFYAMTQGGFQAQTSNQSGNGSIGLGNNGEFHIGRNGRMVYMTNNGLTYGQDYSADFVDRSLVDKAYVDSKASPANLQTVLDSGNSAQSSNSNSRFSVDFENDAFDVNMNSIDGTGSSLNMTSTGFAFNWFNPVGNINFHNDISNNLVFHVVDYNSNTDTIINLTATHGLTYGDNYSSKFTDSSLVDKAYVDSKTSPANLQSVLDTGNSATSPNGENLISLDVVNGILSSSLSNSFSGFSSVLNQSPAQISFDSTQNDGSAKGTSFNQTPNTIILSSQKNDLNALLKFDALELLNYNEDYSSRYTNRTLVDKAYVDAAIAGGGSIGDFVTLAGIDVPSGDRMEGNFLLANYNILTETPPDNSIQFGFGELFGGVNYTGTFKTGTDNYSNTLFISPTAFQEIVSVVKDSINHRAEFDLNPEKISFKQTVDSSVIGIDIEAEGISFEGLELTTNDSYPIVVIDPATGKLYYRML